MRVTLSVPRSPIEPRENHRRRSLQLFVPALIGGLHFNDAVRLQAHGGDAGQRVTDRDAPRDFELALRHRPLPKQLGQRARHDGMK